MRRPLLSLRTLLVAVPLLALAYVGSGVYSVESDESALAFRLGRVVGRDVLPGIHWNSPWPVGRVIVEKTATNFVMPVGYRLIDRVDLARISDLWLSGDTNVITLRLNIQYSVHSLADLVLNHESPRELLRRVGERALTEYLLEERVDDVLTTRRQRLLAAVQARIQELMDTERSGIDVQSVTVRELGPPVQGGVRKAFQAVQDASADRERSVYEARAYSTETLAEAGARGERLRSEAHAVRHSRIAMAEGEAARFRALAEAHARAPQVTEERLYLESIERFLPVVDTYVVEPGEKGKVNLRFMR